VWPRFNKNNDTIYVVAPGNGKFYQESLESVREELVRTGYKIDIPNELFDKKTLFHSNNDLYRFNHLEKLIRNPEVKVIWCLAGGYGSAKLIDNLISIPKPENEKIFIGFSDITALHIFFNKNWEWNTIHGSTLGKIIQKNGSNPDNIKKILNISEGKSIPITIDARKLNDVPCPDISVPLIGGNLSMIQTCIGTPWQIDTKGNILILEDVNEYGYKVDRMLLHLKQAGILHSVEALIFGDFTGYDELNGINAVDYAIENFAKEMHVPTFRIESIGHGHDNIPFVYGGHACITINADDSMLYSLKLPDTPNT
jgi:muramoyltetrapeptide carboxypeptidase